MIVGFNGQIVLTLTTLWFAIVWLGIGMLCTLFTERRGLYLAIIIPILVGGFISGTIFILNQPGPSPTFQFFRFERDLSAWLNTLIIPVFACVIGGLLGELISPSVEE